jgi:hypothetical protein
MREMTPELLRGLAGVDRLPVPADPEMIRAALQRHRPTDLRAGGGSVTVDVTVDAAGAVTEVRAAPRPADPSARMVLRERDGSERMMDVRRDPGLASAAEAALREIRFTPAERDGEPVPVTFRMTVTFDAGR